MPKQDEIGYLARLTAEERARARDKPFSEQTARLLSDLGLVMTLLPPPPARILDLGVGTGWTTVFLGLSGYRAVGQDIAPDMITEAERNATRYGPSGAAFVVSDYERLPYDAEFDGAVFFDALHHAADPTAALRSVYRALKPGGACITVEPGEGHAIAEGSLAAMERFGVTEQDMPPHLIIALGRTVGFREFQVHERAVAPRPVFVSTAQSPPSPGPSVKPRRGQLVLGAALHLWHSLARPIPDPPAPPSPPAESELQVLQASNVVVLRK